MSSLKRIKIENGQGNISLIRELPNPIPFSEEHQEIDRNHHKTHNKSQDKSHVRQKRMLDEGIALKCFPEYYERGAKIGSGSFGHVYKGKDTRNNRSIVIKKIPGLFLEQEHFSTALSTYREIVVFKYIQDFHPNLMRSTGAFIKPKANKETFDCVYLVLDSADMDLHTFMESTPHMTLFQVKHVIYQLASAVHFLHQHNIMHRDIKPANVLIDFSKDGRILLADFGLSRAMDIDKGIVGLSSSGIHSTHDTHGTPEACQTHPNLFRSFTRHITTRYYRAPEVILCEGYDLSADVWSVGTIFAELLIRLDGFKASSLLHPLFNGSRCLSLSCHGSSDESSDGHDGDSDGQSNDQVNGKTNGQTNSNSHESSGKPRDPSISKTDIHPKISKPDSYLSQIQIILQVIPQAPHKHLKNASSRQQVQQFTQAKSNAEQYTSSLSELFGFLDPDTYDLLRRLLAFEPQHRISCSDMLMHPCFNDYKASTHHDFVLKESKPFSPHACILHYYKAEYEIQKLYESHPQFALYYKFTHPETFENARHQQDKLKTQVEFENTPQVLDYLRNLIWNELGAF